MNSGKLLGLLEYLKGLDKEIVIIGHDNADCDSIISMILMSNWLTANNVKNKPVICDEVINKETYNILKARGVDLDGYRGTISEADSVFLLDHYKTIHNCNVVGCLDHHPTLETVDYPFYLNEKISSTSLLVFIAMQKTGYKLSKSEAYMIVMATFIDTCSRMSSKYVISDEWFIHNLVCSYNLDIEELINIGLCLTDLSIPIDEICTNGRKNYTYTGVEVSSSYIQVNSFSEFISHKNEYIDYIQSKLLNNTTKLWVFIISNLVDSKQIEYRVTNSRVDEINHESILSRGGDIMPKIEKDILNLV